MIKRKIGSENFPNLFFYYDYRANRRAIGHAKCRKVAPRGWRLRSNNDWFNYRKAMIEAIV